MITLVSEGKHQLCDPTTDEGVVAAGKACCHLRSTGTQAVAATGQFWRDYNIDDCVRNLAWPGVTSPRRVRVAGGRRPSRDRHDLKGCQGEEAADVSKAGWSGRRFPRHVWGA